MGQAVFDKLLGKVLLHTHSYFSQILGIGTDADLSIIPNGVGSTIIGDAGTTTITWANGVDTFTAEWDERASYSYS